MTTEHSERRLSATVNDVVDAAPKDDSARRAESIVATVARFVLMGLLALVLLGALMAWASGRAGTDQAVQTASELSRVTAAGIVEPVLTDDLLDQRPDTLDDLDRIVRDRVLDDALVRVKVWGVDGAILYSDEPRLIGERFDLAPAQLRVIETGEPHAEVSDLDRPEHQFEIESRLVAVSRMVATVEGAPLLYESYYRYDAVTESRRSFWSRFAPLAIGTLVALQLFQIPFVIRLVRRIRDGREEREILLRRAVGSTSSRRSRLPEVGLEPALGALLSAVAERGIATELDVQLNGHEVVADVAGLVHRVVRESVRSMLRRPGATALKVSVNVASGGVHVIVDGNGQGFSEGEIIDAQLASGVADEHARLTAIGGIITDVGGRFEVLSDPETGTRVNAAIPSRLSVSS